jgi:negative regulator of flagellin synthesis FlgM
MANSIDSYLGNSAASAATGNSATSVATNRSSQTSASTSSTGAANATPSAEVSQKVRISDTAAKLASIGSTLSAQPAIDQAKVAQISKALANGTYTISADKIASGLMQSDQALAQIGID